MDVIDIGRTKILIVPGEGPSLGSEQDALDLIGEAFGTEAAAIAVPASRLHRDFLRLRTGMAGAFLQKMQNYGYRFAVVGDIAEAVASSDALRDFIYESNMGGRMLFADDMDDLARRIRAVDHEGLTGPAATT